MQTLKTALIQEYSALSSLTTCSTSSSRAGLGGMSACASSSRSSGLLMCSLLRKHLLVLAEYLELGGSKTKRGVCDGLRSRVGHQARWVGRQPMALLDCMVLMEKYDQKTWHSNSASWFARGNCSRASQTEKRAGDRAGRCGSRDWAGHGS